jgi:hypothetical protein
MKRFVPFLFVAFVALIVAAMFGSVQRSAVVRAELARRGWTIPTRHAAEPTSAINEVM